VTYQGVALKGGNITFLTPDGKQSFPNQIREDGSYKIDKVPPGTMRILVETESLNLRYHPRPRYTPPAGMQAAGGYTPPDPWAQAQRYVPIPWKYAEAATTDLTCTVTGGAQEHNITLQ
jgi:hypothetical protein